MKQFYFVFSFLFLNGCAQEVISNYYHHDVPEENFDECIYGTNDCQCITDDCQCTTEFLRQENNVNHCYRLFDNSNYTWLDAKEQCENWRGTLAAISTPDEYNFVSKKLPLSTNGYWIGAFNLKDDLSYQWVNNESWILSGDWGQRNHLPWKYGMPDVGIEIPCVAFFNDGFESKECNDTKYINGYICEKLLSK